MDKTPIVKITQRVDKYKICPMCGNILNECQCYFGGECCREEYEGYARDVVLDHLYLFTDEQIKHIQEVQKLWQISYGDTDKDDIRKEYLKVYG